MVLLSIKLQIAVSVVLLVWLTLASINAVQHIYHKRIEHKTLHERVVNRLLEKASDDKPIVLSVNQDRLIEKTADEIERRKAVKKQIE